MRRLLIIAGAVVLALAAVGTPAHASSGAQLFAPGVISSSDKWEYRLSFTPDGKTAYFTRANDNWFVTDTSQVMVSHRTGRGWSPPTVTSFSGVHKDIDPVITPDGATLFFASIRPVDGQQRTDSDIWMVQRTADGGWGEPRNVGAGVNSPSDELYPSVTADGTLYFSSSRPGGLGDHDIYRARPRPDGGYEPAENLGAAVNTPGLDFNPEILGNGRILLYAALGRADQTGGPAGGSDLYASVLVDGAWTQPRNLGPKVNTTAWEYHPTLSPLRDRLYFVRVGQNGDFYSIRSWELLVDGLGVD